MKCHVCQSQNLKSTMHMPGAPYIDRVRYFDSEGNYLPQLETANVWCSRRHSLTIGTIDGTYCGHKWWPQPSSDFSHAAPLSRQDLKDLKKIGAITNLTSKERAHGKIAKQS